MTEFNFKHWIQACSLTPQEAAKELSLPQALVSRYLEGIEVAVHHREACEALTKKMKKKRQDSKAVTLIELGDQSRQYQDCLADLLICLNHDKKKETFWPVADKATLQKLDPFLVADVHGLRTITKKIQTQKTENKFQPYESTVETVINRFYSLEFLPFDDDGKKWTDEEFFQYSLSTRYFHEKKKKLSERAITYLFGNNIDILVDKVKKDE